MLGRQQPSGQSDAPAGRFTAISAGGDHSCGITADGAAQCWGNNASGPVGCACGPVHRHLSRRGSFVWDHRRRRRPMLGPATTGGESDAPAGRFTAISPAGVHSCGITADGAAQCWGDGTAKGSWMCLRAGSPPSQPAHFIRVGSPPTAPPNAGAGTALRAVGCACGPVHHRFALRRRSGVVLSRGGLGPTSVGAGRGRSPCAPNAPTCRYLDVELRGFGAGTYSVSCAHDGWGSYGASVFWTFSLTVDSSGSAVSRGPCYLDYAQLTGDGAYISVTGPGTNTVTSNWLK